MDLMECPACAQRFLVRDGTDGSRRACPCGGEELGLVAQSMPGTAKEIERALGARLLDGEQPS